MRAELPWNVAGIPPEAREAARAAARREGLSVGEWLTRRILRSFSDLGEEAAAMSHDGQYAPDDRALDAWGMPAGSSGRRDTEEMLSRVSRTEAEASEAYRRIEEHLRTVARRLDTAERSQSENNRAMSRTATEINLATREQAEAFDQLGGHVLSIGDRLDRLERDAAQDGVKDAVKALHQGLSRLADQITQIATHSAQQVSSVSDNLEQVAGRLGQMRSDIEATARRLESRIVAAEEESRARFITADKDARARFAAAEQESHGHFTVAEEKSAARLLAAEDETRKHFAAFEAQIARTLDQRLAAVEKASDFAEAREESHTRLVAVEEETRNRLAAFETEVARAMDERLAAVVNASHLDAVEEETKARFTAFQAEVARTMDQRLEAQAAQRAGEQAELQKRQTDTDGAIKRLAASVERLDAKGADPVLERRLDGIEKILGNLVGKLENYDPSAAVEDKMRGFTNRIETVEKSHGKLQDELRANLAIAAEPAKPAPQPTYDPAIFDDKVFAPEEKTAFDAPPFAEPAATTEDKASPFQDEDSFETRVFADDDTAPADDFPPPADVFVPPADDLPPPAEAFTPPAVEEPSAENENFLAAARRSARAAAEAESNRANKLAFAWGTSAPAETGERPRYVVPAILGLLVVLALIGGVVLSQKFRNDNVAVLPIAPEPAPVGNTPAVTTAPKALPPAAADTAVPPPQSASVPVPASPATAVPAPAAPVPAPKPAAGARAKAPTLDRVTQLANGGNAAAQTILGLKELDGDGVPANPIDAAKWLERAANQGQAVAQYRLGAVYERGQGVVVNPLVATHWYQLAANQGNRKAMHNLAVANASGTAGKRDMAEAARWFARAAALGLADSQFNLAVLYERGDGVPQSLLDAYKWYAIAAAQGDAESRSRLNVLTAQLSVDDRSAAQKSAAAFKPTPLNSAANIPPEMADLSGN